MTAPAGERRAATRTMRAALRRARHDVPTWGRAPIGPAAAVAIGLVIGMAAIAAKAILNAVLGGDTGFPVLIGAAAIAAWTGGLTGGITATILTGILNAFIFESAAGPSFVVTGFDLARSVLYIVIGAIVSYLIATLRTSRDRLVASLADVGAMAAEIERRDERLELVLAASGTGYWEWDVVSGDLVWSEAIFLQHGLDPFGPAPTFEAYLGTVHPDDRAAFQADLDETMRSGRSFSREFRVLWPDGSVHWTHGVGRAFLDATGRPIRMAGTGQDITERRRVEAERDRLLDEERRAGAFREAFLEVVSHELRTPITTILGLTHILARPGRTTSAEERAGLIEDISAESERLHRLVEDLLVLTRAERGEFAIESEPLELRRILGRVVAVEAGRLPGHRIDLAMPATLPVVAGEEIYVEQIVRNMLGNAAKYTPPGTTVTVTATPGDHEVAIRILDTGPGIDPDSADRVFDLFYRDPVRARTIAGSGIGLFVCRSLVEAMGGRIWARLRPEGGTEFGFTLHVLADDEPAGTTVGDAAVGVPAGGRTPAPDP